MVGDVSDTVTVVDPALRRAIRTMPLRISAYHPQTLRQLGSAAVPTSHGIWVTRTGDVFTTNIGGGGLDAVWLLDRHLTATVAVADTAFATPHNLAGDGREARLLVTHSGRTANRVTVFKLTGSGFGAATPVTVGTNPFGLGLVI